MFHINKEYNEDNDRIKKEETDMENHPHTAHGTWFQLSLHAGSISRVGGCRHRFCRGFFRFLYAIACLLVTLAIIAAILSFLIF